MPDEPKERKTGARRPLELLQQVTLGELTKEQAAPTMRVWVTSLVPGAGTTADELLARIPKHGEPGDTFRIVRPIGCDQEIVAQTSRKLKPVEAAK